MDLNATVGDASANAYADVDEANELATARSHAAAGAWRDSSDDDAKARALMTATAAIDAIPSHAVAFYGEKASAAQALEFPRETDNGVLPRPLTLAAMELAFTYLADAGAATPSINDKKSVDVGGVKVEWFDRATRQATPLDWAAPSAIAALNEFPLVVQKLLAPLIAVLYPSNGWGAAAARRVS